jgi:hypothetical protein
LPRIQLRVAVIALVTLSLLAACSSSTADQPAVDERVSTLTDLLDVSAPAPSLLHVSESSRPDIEVDALMALAGNEWGRLERDRFAALAVAAASATGGATANSDGRAATRLLLRILEVRGQRPRGEERDAIADIRDGAIRRLKAGSDDLDADVVLLDLASKELQVPNDHAAVEAARVGFDCRSGLSASGPSDSRSWVIRVAANRRTGALLGVRCTVRPADNTEWAAAVSAANARPSAASAPTRIALLWAAQAVPAWFRANGADLERQVTDDLGRVAASHPILPSQLAIASASTDVLTTTSRPRPAPAALTAGAQRTLRWEGTLGTTLDPGLVDGLRVVQLVHGLRMLSSGQRHEYDRLVVAMKTVVDGSDAASAQPQRRALGMRSESQADLSTPAEAMVAMLLTGDCDAGDHDLSSLFSDPATTGPGLADEPVLIGALPELAGALARCGTSAVHFSMRRWKEWLGSAQLTMSRSVRKWIQAEWACSEEIDPSKMDLAFNPSPALAEGPQFDLDEIYAQIRLRNIADHGCSPGLWTSGSLTK